MLDWSDAQTEQCFENAFCKIKCFRPTEQTAGLCLSLTALYI